VAACSRAWRNRINTQSNTRNRSAAGGGTIKVILTHTFKHTVVGVAKHAQPLYQLSMLY
jgi:hypothetical protein